MGTNINYKKLKESRIRIMDDILNHMKDWDEDIESGVKLVENNRIQIDKVKSINEQIDSINPPNPHDDEYKDKLNALYIEQKRLFKVLESKQRNLMDEKEQLNKKDHVLKSYISKKRQSIFIDKDVR